MKSKESIFILFFCNILKQVFNESKLEITFFLNFEFIPFYYDKIEKAYFQILSWRSSWALISWRTTSSSSWRRTSTTSI